MLTWKLWNMLEAVPSDRPTHRLLNIKLDDTHFPVLYPLIALVGLCLCIAFPYFLIPMGILVLMLRFSLRIAGGIAKQIEAGNYAVLATTPIGALGMALEISYFYTIGARVILKIGLLSALSGVVTLGLTLLAAILLSPMSDESNFDPLVVGFFLWGIGGLLLVEEIAQHLSLGVMLGMLAGTMGERNTARVASVASYIGIQMICYFLLFLLFSLITRFIAPLALEHNIDVAVRVLFSAVVYFGVREAVIYALWRQVLLRFNDDAPLRKSKIKQG